MWKYKKAITTNIKKIDIITEEIILSSATILLNKIEINISINANKDINKIMNNTYINMLTSTLSAILK